MPVKTKAQKVAADIRRETISYTLPTVSESLPNVPAKTVAISDDYSYVTKDLKRIGVFTVLAFGAEIVLWYLLRAG